tara:strand:+ start:2855 stop:3151 length:297 start_codon:yes stop_codon:yes gene_type:complete
MDTKDLSFDILKKVMNNPEKTKQQKMFFFEIKMYNHYLKAGNRSYALEFRKKGCPDSLICHPDQKQELKEIFGDVIKVRTHPLITKPGKILFRWNKEH